jgi:hypothetical protein
MKASIPLWDALALEIGGEPRDGIVPDGGAGPAGGADPAGARGYPTARLSKGLLLVDGGAALAGEGVGFGVPIVKRGVTTIFPGRVHVTCRHDGPAWEVAAAYDLCLVERLAGARRGGRPAGGGASGRLARSRALYAAKDSLAALHRRVPWLRGPLAATSAAVRHTFDWVTTYEETEPCGTVTVRHVVWPVDVDMAGRAASGGAAGDLAPRRGAGSRVAVTVDLSGLAAPGITEVVVMNEQGAPHFDRYEDSDGAVLHDGEVGSWDLVAAARAAFVSGPHGVSFALAQAPGARLYRGRERAGSRLAWTGFGYSVRPQRRTFAYELRIASAA